jgi:hypothetical protein
MVSRLRRLFFIAGSNFIIPGLLNAVQLTLVFVLPKHSDPPARQSQLFFICAFIMIVFNYVCIIGVVFATIWATGSSLLSGSNQGSWPSGSVVGGTYSKVASTHRKVDFRPQGFRPMSSNDRVSIDNASIPLMDKESSTGHSQFQDKK